jgi:uncharacterized protein YegP (UPF0339 family)
MISFEARRRDATSRASTQPSISTEITMSARYELKKSSNWQYYFTLQSDNNETILTSETYSAKQGALDGIASVKRNCTNDATYARYTNSRGKFMFNLKAPNNQVLGSGEEYNTTTARENGIAAVKRVGPTAPVVDLT